MLQGRTAVVTGAARGIGAAIARAMAAEGAHVLLADLDGEAAQAVAASIGPKAWGLRADVAEPNDAARLASEAVARFGSLDILVNNAGIAVHKTFMDTTVADLDRIMRVNVTGAMLCAQAALRVMLPHGHGRIVNIVSISGIVANAGRAAYGASKAALELMTKVMAHELAGQGVTVNAIAPGPIDTDLAAAVHTDEVRRGFHDRTPVGRYGTPEEIAAASVFLASDAAGYVNGHTLTVDGGFSIAGLKG